MTHPGWTIYPDSSSFSSIFIHNDIPFFLNHFAILEVTLKVTFVTSFEDEQATVALGTGFVVDKERGLILTNRHITGVGPVRALAIFDRHEELEVEVWRGEKSKGKLSEKTFEKLWQMFLLKTLHLLNLH